MRKIKIKICRFVDTGEAEYAAKAGADYIGINFSPISKCYVAKQKGAEIAKAAKQNGAEPVAVLVNEQLDDILKINEVTGIRTFQLHGDGSKECLKDIPDHFSIIYAIGIHADGSSEIKQRNALENRKNSMQLFDNPQPGSGKKFNWTSFKPPADATWILAGGLTPDNVVEAITLLQPFGVDVASGVEIIKNRKNPILVKTFIDRVRLLEGNL